MTNELGNLQMQISFLLVNFNMSGIVSNCVHNIQARCSSRVEYEIIIADNSTNPQFRLPANFIQEHPHVRHVVLEENRGWVAAINSIRQLACGEFVAIMHPDVELSENCIEGLIDFLHRHPKAGVVSPDLYYPDGRPNRIRTALPTLSSEARLLANMIPLAFLKRKLIRDEALWDREGDVEVEMVMSVCMVMRRSVLEQIGDIEPRLRFYYANDYLCTRARRNGWSCHYVAAARAVHFERYTPRALYAKSQEMAYKADPLPATPRMRADYFVFLGTMHPAWKVAIYRALAVCQDGFQLLVQCRRLLYRREHIRCLWRSVRINLGFRLE